MKNLIKSKKCDAGHRVASTESVFNSSNMDDILVLQKLKNKMLDLPKVFVITRSVVV
jgi:hypothetical protein